MGIQGNIKATAASIHSVFLRSFSELSCSELILQASPNLEIAGKAREGEYAQIFIQPLIESG
jgi:hypothetical protein